MTQTLACPICKGIVTEGSQPFPFCSSRCRLIDLGKWLDEKYSIETVDEPPPPNEKE